MTRRLAPAFYLGLNLLLAVSIVWLAEGRLALGPAIALAGGIACFEVALWYIMMRSREAEAPHENRLVAVMERSARARRFSIRDETTGLLNRWYLERRLDEEASRCKRYGYSMAVIVLKTAVPQISGMSIDNWQESSTDAAQRCLSVVRNVDLSALLGRSSSRSAWSIATAPVPRSSSNAWWASCRSTTVSPVSPSFPTTTWCPTR